nr:hypothetical protein [Bordetella sp. FB-8]
MGNAFKPIPIAKQGFRAFIRSYDAVNGVRFYDYFRPEFPEESVISEQRGFTAFDITFDEIDFFQFEDIRQPAKDTLNNSPGQP